VPPTTRADFGRHDREGGRSVTSMRNGSAQVMPPITRIASPISHHPAKAILAPPPRPDTGQLIAALEYDWFSGKPSARHRAAAINALKSVREQAMAAAHRVLARLRVMLASFIVAAVPATTVLAQNAPASRTTVPMSAEQTLSIASSAPVTSIDPHYHTLSPNESFDSHVYERLIDRDAAGHIVPSLAESWKLVDDTTWEFKLRSGVTFHDGTPFTAEDVEYSINRIPQVKNSPASFSIYTKAIKSVEVIDPHTVRLHTADAYPLLPVDLSQVFIIPHELGPDPATEDFNGGKNAIGTGPYRFISFKPSDRIELERYDGYWGRKPHWQHISYRMINNDAARTAALLAGDVGIIEFVPPTDLAKLRSDPRVALSEVVSNRSIFLWLDHSHDGPTPYVFGPNGETLTKNPLKDKRVRLALSLAINRAAIIERVMEGAAIPTGQYLPPGAPTYNPAIKPPPYDPVRAKALLAEAGYPNGLRITLNGPNDRYVNDAKIIQAVGQMWQRIGVQTTVEPMPWAAYVGRAGKQEMSAFLMGWGVSSGEGTNPLRAQLATWDAARGMGTANRGRYSNPALDKMIDQALRTMDDGAREKIVQDAMALAMDDVPVIMLHLQKNIWATRKGLTYEPRVDEETRAMSVRAQ
jgi:peptide/nickel transport system substrate-binding protein